jgi:hypothetical protein
VAGPDVAEGVGCFVEGWVRSMTGVTCPVARRLARVSRSWRFPTDRKGFSC